MLISQISGTDGRVHVVARDGTEAYIVENAASVYALAREAAHHNTTLTKVIGQHGFGAAVDLEEVYDQNRILVPVTHEDAAHLYVTGTGLTHYASATARDLMHQQPSTDNQNHKTDSMKMFDMGMADGKPAPGDIGIQPEWFFKGNGNTLVATGYPLASPQFAGNGGEEPEIAGIYIIGGDGTPFRIGYALTNEFSDHVMENQNYLYLAHSKLRQTAIGPEILIGDLPRHISGHSRIIRNGTIKWDKPFVSGEDNMTHSLANLEHHHFKYGQFRQPGDIHIHMFGCAILSYSDGFVARAGDIFEIDVPDFGLALRNVLKIAEPESFAVKAL